MQFVGDPPASPLSCLKEPGGVLVEYLETKTPSELRRLRPSCHLGIPSIAAWLGLTLKQFIKEPACHMKKIQSQWGREMYACICCCHQLGPLLTSFG